jgi:hypothetical protein
MKTKGDQIQKSVSEISMPISHGGVCVMQFAARSFY